MEELDAMDLPIGRTPRRGAKRPMSMEKSP